MVATLPGADLALALELANTFSLRRGRAIDGLTTPRASRRGWPLARIAWVVPGSPTSQRPTCAPFASSCGRASLRRPPAGGRPTRSSADLNRLSRGAPQYVELRWPQGAAPGVHVRVRSRTPGATALAAVARSAIELLGGPARNRLRRCGGPRCVLFFLATDPRQTWCSGACGNRARMARYQAARRARRAGLAAARNPLASGQPQEERLLRRPARPRTGTMSKGSRSSPTRRRSAPPGAGPGGAGVSRNMVTVIGSVPHDARSFGPA